MRTGLHCNTTRDEAKLLDYYRKSGANVVKVMEFHGPTLDKLKALGVTIIGRVYDDDQKLAGTKAGDFIARVVQHARDYPQVDYWEGYNEAFSDGDDMNRFADMEILRMRALEMVGKKAIIACFSTGTPEIEDWPRFRPALEYAAAHGHALGLHEYSGPFMQWLAGENQWDHERGVPKRIDDRCLSPAVEGWLTLRYRKAYALFRQWGLQDLPLFITEGGIDDVQPRPGPQGKGYKDFAGTEWARLPGIGDYAEMRRWYMWQVSHDRYMKGVVDFGWDTADPTWRSFDLSSDSAMLDRIIQLEASLPVGHIDGGVPVPVPPPPPPPAPSPPKSYVAYSQRDPRWAGLPLGNRPGYTVGMHGCTLTCLAMMASKLNPLLTPGELNVRMARVGGFTPDALLQWAKVAPATDGALAYRTGATWRESRANVGTIASILSRGPALIQVDFKPATGALDTHWVLGLAMTADGHDIVCVDPWHGDECRLLQRYGRRGWDLGRAVYAIRELRPA